MADKPAWLRTEPSPSHPCPLCGETLDMVTGVHLDDPAAKQSGPQPGDVTACVYCRHLLVFTTTGLRLATQADFDSLAPELQQLMAAFMRGDEPLTKDTPQ